MLRDPDLIRYVLLQIAKIDLPQLISLDPEIISTDNKHPFEILVNEYSLEEVVYHLQLILDASFIRGKVLFADSTPYAVMISELTWDGQEWVALIYDTLAWETVRSKMDRSGGGFVFEVAKDWLMDYKKNNLTFD